MPRGDQEVRRDRGETQGARGAIGRTVMKNLKTGVIAAAFAGILLTASAVWADRWDIRREVAEGNREIRRERREARREILRADSPWEMRREFREAGREIRREQREKRREVGREVRQAVWGW